MDLLAKFLTVLAVALSVGPTPTFMPVITPKIIAPLTLDRIFDNRLEIPENNKNTVILITTGDVIPARTVNLKMNQNNDFTFPFSLTADYLNNADLTVINLEAPLTKKCPVTDEGMIFCGDQRFIQGLNFAGIDAATLGNNHALNYGFDGLNQTANLLRQNNILYAGYPENNLSNLAVKEVKGKTFGILAYNILENPDQEQILTEIKQAKQTADFLLVAYHWGAEYVRMPAPETVELAHQSIEAGADFILGNHPHWIQPIEIYKDKLIVYAHGNFIFDQEWSEETKKGYVVKSVISGNRIIDAEIMPVLIEDFARPGFLQGNDKNEILEQLESISQNQAEKILTNQDRN